MIKIYGENKKNRAALFIQKHHLHLGPCLPFSFKNITFIWLPQTSSYAFFIQKRHLHLVSTNVLVCLFHSKTSPSFGFHKHPRMPFSFKNITFIWLPQTRPRLPFHSKTSPSFGFHKQINFYSHTFYSRPFYTILKKL